MYYLHGIINQGYGICPLIGGCPLFGGFAIRGFTVLACLRDWPNAHFQLNGIEVKPKPLM